MRLVLAVDASAETVGQGECGKSHAGRVVKGLILMSVWCHFSDSIIRDSGGLNSAQDIRFVMHLYFSFSHYLNTYLCHRRLLTQCCSLRTYNHVPA